MSSKAYGIARRNTAAALILMIAFVLTVAGAAAESLDANTMRLLHYEGDVVIEDAGGTPRFVMPNVRFASGESMSTGEGASASVGLDDTKIVSLDQSSRVQFVREGDHMEMTLTKGTLFLDVQEKLGDDETLDIQTSTMTVGIRGTIVFATEEPAGSSGAGITRVGILEGVAKLDFVDAAGVRRMLDLPAGKIVTVPNADRDGIGVSPTIRDMTAEDLEGFVISQIEADENLIIRIVEGSPAGPQLLLSNGSEDIHPPEGDDSSGKETGTVRDDPITLVAQSASKLYDGQPLSRSSDVLVYGLPQDYTIQVSARGSQTAAGSAENVVADYVIRDSAGQDVTGSFTNITTVSGQLRVDPAPLIVWTGSAQKYYDGEPLTCDEAELRTTPGYVMGETPLRNTSYVVRTAVGSETMMSVCGCTWVHGTNPLTGETQEAVLYTGQQREYHCFVQDLQRARRRCDQPLYRCQRCARNVDG